MFRAGSKHSNITNKLMSKISTVKKLCLNIFVLLRNYLFKKFFSFYFSSIYINDNKGKGKLKIFLITDLKLFIIINKKRFNVYVILILPYIIFYLISKKLKIFLLEMFK